MSELRSLLEKLNQLETQLSDVLSSSEKSAVNIVKKKVEAVISRLIDSPGIVSIEFKPLPYITYPVVKFVDNELRVGYGSDQLEENVTVRDIYNVAIIKLESTIIEDLSALALKLISILKNEQSKVEEIRKEIAKLKKTVSSVIEEG